MSSSIRAIPRTFKMPEEYTAWQEFIQSEAGAAMEWVQKSALHRGVKIISDTAAPELQQLQGVLVQQLVRPHLIGGRSWDVGECCAVWVWIYICAVYSMWWSIATDPCARAERTVRLL
jgi:hypothetical protein